MGPTANLTELPTDLFLMITSFLDPLDIVKCRLVSRSWHTEFTEDSFLREILIREYPKAYEVRNFLSQRPANGVPGTQVFSSNSLNDWKRIFDKVVARYCALKNGKPWQVTRKDLAFSMPPSGQLLVTPWEPFQHRCLQVTEWDRYLQLPPPGQLLNIPIDLPEPGWTYDSGLLVYADVSIAAYTVLDLEADSASIVPFDIEHCIVRRLRLKKRVLVIEWAEAKPYHQINGTEQVHRHYVSVFDIVPVTGNLPWLPRWNVVFRNEWNLHYLGFPLLGFDIWLSSHSETHFAAYFWLRNRSAWGEDEPIESLGVWDISGRSDYRPSTDSGGRNKASEGPQLIKKLSFVELDFLTIRQRDTPTLRKIEIDDSCVYFFEEASSHEYGSHVADQRWNPAATRYWERVIGVPVLGLGPHWEDRLDDSSITVGSELAQNLGEGSFHKATCWRYQGIYPGVRNHVIQDRSAGIYFSAEHDTDGHFSLRITSKSNSWTSTIRVPNLDWLTCKPCGDERWLITQVQNKLCILHFERNPQI